MKKLLVWQEGLTSYNATYALAVRCGDMYILTTEGSRDTITGTNISEVVSKFSTFTSKYHNPLDVGMFSKRVEDMLEELRVGTGSDILDFPWDKYSGLAAKYFPASIDIDKYNWAENSIDIVKYCPQLIPHSPLNWEEAWQHVVLHAPHLLDVSKLDNTKLSKLVETAARRDKVNHPLGIPNDIWVEIKESVGRGTYGEYSDFTFWGDAIESFLKFLTNCQTLGKVPIENVRVEEVSDFIKDADHINLSCRILPKHKAQVIKDFQELAALCSIDMTLVAEE